MSTFAVSDLDAQTASLYEVAGHRGPVVVVLGGISASRHVTATDDKPEPGWWQSIVGQGRAIDMRRACVLGIDYLGHRPLVTTHEQAQALAATLDRLGISRVAAIVGASYGGMVALAFADAFPDRLERLVVISAAHESHPMTTGLRAIQRRIVQLGCEASRPTDGLALARALAMTTYRTAAEFAQRFATRPIGEDAIEFESERYLLHHGCRFAAAWEPERFLALSLSMDLHHVTPEGIRTPTVLVAAEGDTLVPEAQMRELARRLGGATRLIHLPTLHGHDAFLTEPAALSSILREALLPIFS